jgi:hypothetical protein
MKDVTGNNHEVRRQFDDLVDRLAKDFADVRLALIHAGGRRPLVLPNA